MNEQDKQFIEETAYRKFNVKRGDEIPQRIVDRIKRTHILPSERMTKEDLSYSERQRISKDAAEQVERELEENQEQKSDSRIASEQFLALQKLKFESERANTGRKNYLKRLVEQAEQQLQEVIETEAEEENKAAIQAKIVSSSSYQRAVENSQTYLNTRSGEDEYREAVLRLERLKSVESVEDIETVVQRYWTDTGVAEKRIEQRLEEAAIPKYKDAADASRVALDAQQQILDSKHLQNIAKIESNSDPKEDG